MSTSQCIIEIRQTESRTSLVVEPVKEEQKLSPINEVLRYPWQEFQGLSWTIMRDEC